MKKDKEKHGTDDNYKSEECISRIDSAVKKNGHATGGGLNAPGVFRIVGLK